MAHDEGSVPATKADIKKLVESIGKLKDHTDRQLAKVQETNRKWKDEILEHFDVRFELLRNDFLGAQSDKFGDHDLRISRLEQNAGLNMG